MHHSATTSPAQGLAMLRPAHAVHTRVPVAAQGGGVQPSPPHPCPLCLTAMGALELWGHGHVGHWHRSEMEETGQPRLWWRAACPHHRCGWRHLGSLFPQPPALPTWGLPGGGHQSPGPILAALVVEMKPDLPSSLLCRSLQPHWLLSPTAAGAAQAAKRCHFLQLGFYRAGGRGAFTELCLHFWSFLRDTFGVHILPGATSSPVACGTVTLFSNTFPTLPAPHRAGEHWL